MEKHLLQKEEEYYKVNDELELKTQHLMKEVENVMNLKPQLQKWAHLSAESKSQCSSATLNSFMNSRDLNVPLSVKTKTPGGFSVEGLKARTTELLEENYGSKLDQNNHVKSCFGRSSDQNPEQELPHIEGISRKVDQLISGLQISTFSDKDLDDEGLCNDLTVDKKISILRHKIKMLQTEMQALQADYKKKNEEWKKLQSDLKVSEGKCTKLQQKTVALTEALKKQEQHNADMSVRLFQKEAENKAINKIHLQASRMIQFTEEEFLKLLDWSPSSCTALP